MGFKIIMVTLIITLLTDNVHTSDDIEFEALHPSLKERQLMYSLYTKTLLSSDLNLLENYILIHNMSKSYYNEKIVEFDSFGWLNGIRQTIFHKLPFFIANPAFRIPQISKEWCESRDFFKLGFRIYQVVREVGLPTQFICATCHPIIEGLMNINFLLPERDFTQELTKLKISSRKQENRFDYCSSIDCEQNPRVANLQDYLMVNDLHFGKITRWNGEHTTTQADRDVMETPNGELAIHSRLSEGFTTTCGLELNGKVVDSNIFVNSDVVGVDRDGEIFTYNDYETFALKGSQTVKDIDLGLEVFIEWEPWGCCSACCCPVAICGHGFDTSIECEQVFSSRSRVGFVSIRRIEKVTVHEPYLISLHKLLSIPPNTHRGIPLFSSLLARNEFKIAVDLVKKKLLPLLAEATNSFSSGMFVESESCKSHIQKTDCTEWARCNNMSLIDLSAETSVTAFDSCHQVHFVDVLVGTENMKVTVDEHHNLRIRIDSKIYDMKTTKAKWRVNLRKPKKYDSSRPCLMQGIVQRNDEILVLNFASWDLKIDLILEDRKVRITFTNARDRENARVIQYTIIYWAIAIAVFFFLLITAVILMHREKTRRLERTIKAVT